MSQQQLPSTASCSTTARDGATTVPAAVSDKPDDQANNLLTKTELANGARAMLIGGAGALAPSGLRKTRMSSTHGLAVDIAEVIGGIYKLGVATVQETAGQVDEEEARGFLAIEVLGHSRLSLSATRLVGKRVANANLALTRRKKKGSNEKDGRLVAHDKRVADAIRGAANKAGKDAALAEGLANTISTIQTAARTERDSIWQQPLSLFHDLPSEQQQQKQAGARLVNEPTSEQLELAAAKAGHRRARRAVRAAEEHTLRSMRECEKVCNRLDRISDRMDAAAEAQRKAKKARTVKRVQWEVTQHRDGAHAILEVETVFNDARTAELNARLAASNAENHVLSLLHASHSCKNK